MKYEIKWQYGVTAVPARFDDLLPRTLKSLEQAGFHTPRIFVDGAQDIPPTLSKVWSLNAAVILVGDSTLRWPAVRTFGNWLLALLELYLRDPNADRYAIFQDDILACRNLREYIERSKVFPEVFRGGRPKGTNMYLNLYSARDHEPTEITPKGWQPSAKQNGRNAVGLVFDNQGVRDVFRSNILEHARDPYRGWRNIDGAVIDRLKPMGYKEWVHNPSLLQHTGLVSQTKRDDQPQAKTFVGEDFNALTLLETPK